MILGVAVKQGDLVICLPKPKRHHHCMKYATEVLGLKPPIGAKALHQGFYLKDGTFLNREEAFKYAKEHNQIINSEARHCLFSEDLW